MAAAMVVSCGKTDKSTVAADGMKLDVAVYCVVPQDSVNIVFVTDTTNSDFLPLKEHYSIDEVKGVAEFLVKNDSLLNAHGLASQFVDFNEPRLSHLIFYKSEPLLHEMVPVTEVNKYQERGTNCQITFSFQNASEWERITGENINKMLAISVNGQIRNAPRVNMPITQGACAIYVNEDVATTLLPGVEIPEQKE